MYKHSSFPKTIIGFRAGLSTQDAFLLVKVEVLEVIAQGNVNLILALELKGAFDNVSHEAVLQKLENSLCGKRVFNYVKSFLTDRTAMIGIGQTRSSRFLIPNKGTPQEAIISLLLFNLAMCSLARRLDAIPLLGYTLYADDISLSGSRMDR